MKTAFISGIGGQDGSYLAESLLDDGYAVHGLIRRSSVSNTIRIDHLLSRENFHLHQGDLLDSPSIATVFKLHKPHEIYNLGCQSHVRISFDAPVFCSDTIVTGTLNMLNAMRQYCPESRYYQASSSEMFGKVLETPQRETTPFNPASPYGCAKACAHYLTKNYRESYKLHASNGILFNHESPRRGEMFVTRKISKAVARIVAKKQQALYLGNLEAKRDWGYAPDFVEAMRLIVNHPDADDYVIATGETHKVQEFLEEAFALVNLDWWRYTAFDSSLVRPSEVDLLLGDASKAKEKLGWTPKTTFKQLVKIMVEADLKEEGVIL